MTTSDTRAMEILEAKEVYVRESLSFAANEAFSAVDEFSTWVGELDEDQVKEYRIQAMRLQEAQVRATLALMWAVSHITDPAQVTEFL